MAELEPPSKAEVLAILSKYRKKITEKDFNILLQHAAFSPDESLKEKNDFRILGEIRGYVLLVKDYLFGEGRKGILTIFVVAMSAIRLVFPNYHDAIISTVATFPDYISHYVGYAENVKSNWIVFSPELPKGEPQTNTWPIDSFLVPNTIIAPISGQHPLATGELEYTGYKLV
jgi:hypothetical protein